MGQSPASSQNFAPPFTAGTARGNAQRHPHTSAQKNGILVLATATCMHLKTIGKLIQLSSYSSC